MTRLLRSFTVIAIFFLLSLTVFGQLCRGSRMVYIVRDPKGVPLKATETGLTIELNDGEKKSNWEIAHGAFAPSEETRFYVKGIPQSITKLDKKISWLGSSEACHFASPYELKLRYKGKTMDLIFLFGPINGDNIHWSADFLVDSRPFAEGKYQILLETPTKGTNPGGYYAASGWKKVK